MKLKWAGLPARAFPKWIVVVALSYVLTFMFQANVIFPVEKFFVPGFTELASLMFLPHAVRTLGTAIVGPRAFWALFPAVLGIHYVDYQPISWALSWQAVLVALTGAGCAPVGYYIVRSVYRYRTSFEAALLNWKPVFAIGVAASLVNTAALCLLFSASFGLRSLPYVVLRFLIGDIVGLAAGLLLLVFCFRILRADDTDNTPQP
ncbi:MAG: hypothetical protein ACE5FS_13750 [Paracoccaceae bacterium]